MLTVNFLLVLEETKYRSSNTSFVKMSQRIYYTFAQQNLIKNPFLFFNTFKLGCQARILLCAYKLKNALVITAVNFGAFKPPSYCGRKW